MKRLGGCLKLVFAVLLALVIMAVIWSQVSVCLHAVGYPLCTVTTR